MINTLRFVWQHPLNASGKWAAIGRLIKWQISARLMDGPIGFRFVEDSKLFASLGMTGATGNFYCGLHEVNEMAFVLHALREEELFLDIGSNIGSYAVLAAAGPKARVIAVEPIPETFAKLQLNISLNGMSEVIRTCQCGVSNKKGTLNFSVDLDTTNRVLTETEHIPSVEVPVITIDDLVSGSCPQIIKIDVEGHELPALKGARGTISNPNLFAVILETNGSGARYGWSDKDLVDLMSASGFTPFAYDPFSRSLVPAHPGTGNTIFLRDQDEVSSRLKAAPFFRVGTTRV